MPVNANSVIPTVLNNWDSAAYTAITNMENYCYTSSSNGTEADYKPFFQSLANAMTSWFGFDRTNHVRDFLEQVYVYILFNNNYGTPDTLLSNFDAHSLFTMNGYLTTIVNQPVSYYDDYVAPTTTTSSSGTTTTTPATATQLTTDTSTINNAAAAEMTSLDSYRDTIYNQSQDFAFKLMFEYIPLINTPLSQKTIGQHVFNTLNWGPAFNYFTINLDKPSYIP